jgi:hypothetical protein
MPLRFADVEFRFNEDFNFNLNLVEHSPHSVYRISRVKIADDLTVTEIGVADPDTNVFKRIRMGKCPNTGQKFQIELNNNLR